MKTKKSSKILGLCALSTLLGVGTGIVLTDGVDMIASNRSQGIPLLAGGVHLSEGNHRVIVTEQFASLLKDDTEEDKKMIVNAMAKSYDRLNDLCDKIKFDFCTTATSIEELGVKKVENVEEYDIPLYLTTHVIDDNPNVLANTDWNYHHFSRVLYNEAITFRKDAMLTVYKELGTVEETTSPLNTFAYTITLHETLHAMGFSHTDNKGSIMYPYISAFSVKDLSKSDEDMIKKYNEVFYNANIDEKCSLKEEDMIL